jgi:hypothetical protein
MQIKKRYRKKVKEIRIRNQGVLTWIRPWTKGENTQIEWEKGDRECTRKEYKRRKRVGVQRAKKGTAGRSVQTDVSFLL